MLHLIASLTSYSQFELFVYRLSSVTPPHASHSLRLSQLWLPRSRRALRDLATYWTVAVPAPLYSLARLLRRSGALRERTPVASWASPAQARAGRSRRPAAE